MLMEINNVYNNYTGSYTKTIKKKEVVKSSEKQGSLEKIEQTEGTRKTAADELPYLTKKYDGYSFVGVNFKPGMRYGSKDTVNVAISPIFLRKMANNPELEEQYEKEIANMKACDEQKVRNIEGQGDRIIVKGWAIDKDGNISSWTIGERGGNRPNVISPNEYGAKVRKQKEEKKKEQSARKERVKKAGQPEKTRKTAADELSYLTKNFDGITFIAANFKPGMRYGTLATTNIAISPEFLKKMVNDPALEKEYADQFENMKKLDEQNIKSHETQGRHLVAQGWAIDKNGGMSKWSISEADNKRHYGQEMTDYANKIRKQKLEKKKEQEKIAAKKSGAEKVTGLNVDMKL